MTPAKIPTAIRSVLTDDAATTRAILYALLCLERGETERADEWIRRASDLAAKGGDK